MVVHYHQIGVVTLAAAAATAAPGAGAALRGWVRTGH